MSALLSPFPRLLSLYLVKEISENKTSVQGLGAAFENQGSKTRDH